LFILYFDTHLHIVNLNFFLPFCMSSFTIATYHLDGYLKSSLNSHQTCNKYNGDMIVLVFFLIYFIVINLSLVASSIHVLLFHLCYHYKYNCH
jgi:hypothetical protein